MISSFLSIRLSVHSLDFWVHILRNQLLTYFQWIVFKLCAQIEDIMKMCK